MLNQKYFVPMLEWGLGLQQDYLSMTRAPKKEQVNDFNELMLW